MLKQRSINQLAFTRAVVGLTLLNHGSFEVYFKSYISHIHYNGQMSFLVLSVQDVKHSCQLIVSFVPYSVCYS